MVATMLQVVIGVLFIVSTSALVAQVDDYIQDRNCKLNYIRPSKPSCVRASDMQCFPFGTDNTYHCTSIEQWQWVNPNSIHSYAPGVNPFPIHRKTLHGEDTQKTVWAYTGSIHQADAYQIYGPDAQVLYFSLSPYL